MALDSIELRYIFIFDISKIARGERPIISITRI